MKIKICVLVFLCSCILVLWGCAGISGKGKELQTSTLLEPQAMLKFNDVPVPVGFRLLSGDSYSFESAGMRVGLLKYQGKAKIEQVVNFYKEQMPMYNWSLLNVVEYGERLMNFARENETCIVNLSPKGNTIIATISLGPKSQIPKKSEKPVK